MLYLDTNILIYLFELHEPYSKKVATTLEEFTKDNKQLVTSAITVTEFLAGTNSSNLNTLHKVPRLNIIPVDEILAEQAAILQRKTDIKIGDSIHLATAIQQQVEAFFTNDKNLTKFVEKYLPVISP
ncbi:MAG: type II toxin-antitoxin system VapC family toxin [Candidatus Saccharimonadales bacterium]